MRDDVVKGLNVYTFHLPEDIFHKSNPVNEGFCEGQCLGNGVFNSSKCSNTPSFITKPHFLDADQKFLDDVDGLSPNRSKHDFLVHFEPVTKKHINFSKSFLIFRFPLL